MLRQFIDCFCKKYTPDNKNGNGNISPELIQPPSAEQISAKIAVDNVIDSTIADYLTLKEKTWSFLYILGIGTTNWKRTLREVNQRRTVFSIHKDRLTDIEYAKHEIAAVDIFVEKAQHFLEQKSFQYGISAIITAAMIFAILVYDYIYLVNYATIPNFFKSLKDESSAPEFGPYIFAMWVLRGSALSAISGAAIYFLASLTRAFLHEATVFWNRRHAVRLGRLFIYLKFAGLNEVDLPAMRRELKIEDVERAFGWNLETTTAFKDIKPEMMSSKSVPGDPAKILEAATNLIKETTSKAEPTGKKKDDK